MEEGVESGGRPYPSMGLTPPRRCQLGVWTPHRPEPVPIEAPMTTMTTERVLDLLEEGNFLSFFSWDL